MAQDDLTLINRHLSELHDEVVEGHELQRLRRSLKKRIDSAKQKLLREELGHRLKQCLTRIFGLAALVEDSKMTAIILWNITSRDRRLVANAIELIDTAFSREVAALVVPLVEARARTEDLLRDFPQAEKQLVLSTEFPFQVEANVRQCFTGNRQDTSIA